MSRLRLLVGRFKNLGESVLGRARLLTAWFGGAQPVQKGERELQQTSQVESKRSTVNISPKQREELNELVGTHLSKVQLIQKRYTKQGYKIRIE